jgi:hypothetical protein
LGWVQASRARWRFGYVRTPNSNRRGDGDEKRLPLPTWWPPPVSWGPQQGHFAICFICNCKCVAFSRISRKKGRQQVLESLHSCLGCNKVA